MPSTTHPTVGSTLRTPLTERLRAFLDVPRFTTISTLDPDGAPHQAVIWYVLDGDGLLINSRVGRHWPRNLDRDPRIAVAVYETERPYHWVGLKGRGLPFRDGDAATADIQALARRYGRDPMKYAGQARITFRVAIEGAFEYGADE